MAALRVGKELWPIDSRFHHPSLIEPARFSSRPFSSNKSPSPRHGCSLPTMDADVHRSNGIRAFSGAGRMVLITPAVAISTMKMTAAVSLLVCQRQSQRMSSASRALRDRCHARNPPECRDANSNGADDREGNLPGFRGYGVLHDAMGGLVAYDRRRRDENERDQHSRPERADEVSGLGPQSPRRRSQRGGNFA